MSMSLRRSSWCGVVTFGLGSFGLFAYLKWVEGRLGTILGAVLVSAVFTLALTLLDWARVDRAKSRERSWSVIDQARPFVKRKLALKIAAVLGLTISLVSAVGFGSYLAERNINTSTPTDAPPVEALMNLKDSVLHVDGQDSAVTYAHSATGCEPVGYMEKPSVLESELRTNTDVATSYRQTLSSDGWKFDTEPAYDDAESNPNFDRMFSAAKFVDGDAFHSILLHSNIDPSLWRVRIEGRAGIESAMPFCVGGY